MKKLILRTPMKWIYGAQIILALVIFPTTIFQVGCKSTPQTVAVKTEGVIIRTVDDAMKAWKDYTDTHTVPQSRITAVHSAYDKYYNAQIVAKAVLMSWTASKTPENEKAWETANAAIVEASVSVIQIVKEFLK